MNTSLIFIAKILYKDTRFHACVLGEYNIVLPVASFAEEMHIDYDLCVQVLREALGDRVMQEAQLPHAFPIGAGELFFHKDDLRTAYKAVRKALDALAMPHLEALAPPPPPEEPVTPSPEPKPRSPSPRPRSPSPEPEQDLKKSTRGRPKKHKKRKIKKNKN